MQTLIWRKSTKRANQTMVEDQWASNLGDLVSTTPGLELEQEEAKQSQPRTTWIWDRNKQAWVETNEAPVIEEHLSANSIESTELKTPPQPSATQASGNHKIGWPKSARKLLPTRASIVHVIDSVALKSKAVESNGADAAIPMPADDKATSIIYDTKVEAEELPIRIIGSDGEQIQSILGRVSDKAVEIKEKLDRQALVAKHEVDRDFFSEITVAERQSQATITAIEENSKARAESIIATLEEKARVRIETIIARAKDKANDEAKNIIAQAEEKAEARAEIIIATTEDKARELTEKIIVQTEEQAKARAEIIVSTTEDKARELTEKIIAQTEEKAEAQAEIIIAKAEDKARELAEKIITQTEEKTEVRAEIIISKAEDKARELAQKIIAQAEEKAETRAENIIATVEEKSRIQAERIASQAEKICHQSISAAEHQIQYLLKAAEEKAPVIKTPVERFAKSMPGQLPRSEKSDHKERSVPYEGTAVLVISPPVDVGKMQKALNRLAKLQDIRVLDLDGSAGRGVTIKLFSRNLARLPSILVSLPEVEKVSDLPSKVNKICYSQRLCPGQRSGSDQPVKRLLVTFEKGTTYLED